MVINLHNFTIAKKLYYFSLFSERHCGLQHIDWLCADSSFGQHVVNRAEWHRIWNYCLWNSSLRYIYSRCCVWHKGWIQLWQTCSFFAIEHLSFKIQQITQRTSAYNRPYKLLFKFYRCMNYYYLYFITNEFFRSTTL